MEPDEDDLAELFEERAAIMEFDAGNTREDAEKWAMIDVYGEGE